MKGAILTRVYCPKTRPQTLWRCSVQDQSEQSRFYGDPLWQGWLRPDCRGYLARERQQEMERCPLAHGGKRQQLRGRDSRRGLSPAGSGVADIPEPDGSPAPSRWTFPSWHTEPMIVRHVRECCSGLELSACWGSAFSCPFPGA